MLTPYLKVIPKRFERLTHALEGVTVNNSLLIEPHSNLLQILFDFRQTF